MSDMRESIKLIADERDRQFMKEGWTPSHDNEHTQGEIAQAAAYYAHPSPTRHLLMSWPWDWKWNKETPKVTRQNVLYQESCSAKDLDLRIRELTKAGALIAAEIERLQRIKLS